MKRFLPILLASCLSLLPGRLGDCDLTSHAGAQVPAAKKSSVDEGRTMETIGLVTTLYLYQTYLNIGLLADCRSEEVHEEKQVQKLLATLVPPLDAVEKQLRDLAKSAGSSTEHASVEKLLDVIPPLRKQGQELQEFWETGKEEHAQRYHPARRDSWQKLSGVLGLKGSGEKAR